MGITPTEAEMISDAIDSALLDVHVALPAQVQTYDASKQTATVALQVQRMIPSGDTFAAESLPVLQNVPVEFYRAGGMCVTLPVKAGTYGMVLFSEASLDQWRSKGAETAPGDVGRHTLTGGVFRPGLVPNSEAIGDSIADDLVLGEIGGVQVRVKPGGVAEVVSAGGPTADDFVAMAGKVIAHINTLQVAHDTHTHVTTATVGASGTPGVITPPPALVGPLGPVASSNLKADN